MECILGVEEGQCVNLSCEVIDPLIPCVDIKKAQVKTDDIPTHQRHNMVAPCWWTVRIANKCVCKNDKSF